MGFLDTLFGRTKPVRPDLDRLFALPSAAVTLQAAAGFTPTGVGSVCFASVEGGAFAELRDEVRALLDADVRRDDGGAFGEGGQPVEFTRDDHGYTWLVARQPAGELSSLVSDLHAVNSVLEGGGFGPQLLCSLVAFREGSADGQPPSTGRPPRTLALVYLYKRGTFYPFAPLSDEKRDSSLELQVRAAVGDDLPMEKDLSRWFPVWGAPGL
ncbi:hypothetical protein [Streptomyces sp. NPDC005438]|uniref:PspA-associated protein PspAB n=1 Tax=Streptomyces sp. NPDC005438 TaxID=3156880 RepID=UPI0033A089EE